MKAYREPSIWIDVVEDKFAFVGPVINMRPICIGTIFQVESKLLLGAYDSDTGVSASYPSLKTDADVDTTSVALHVVQTETGEEYDVTDGLVTGGPTPTITSTTLTIPSGMYDELIDSTSGARGTTGLYLSDSGEDFSVAMRGDKIVFTDNNGEVVTVDQVDTTGKANVVIEYGKNIIYYDAKVVGKFFAVGDTVIGSVTGASAEVLNVFLDSTGAAGYILTSALNPAATPFQDNENLLVETVTFAVANGVQALIGTDKKLSFHTLTAPAAISIGDTLGGAVASGDVLYVQEDTATEGFVLLDMAVAGFVNAEALDIGAGTIANADGVARNISGAYGMIDAPSIIYYDALTVDFLAGQTLTGGTSTATAEIIYVYKSGTVGYLVLGTVAGVFQDNETITDDQSVAGSATSNGADAKAEESQILYYDALSAVGAISIGDVLEGVGGARGTVLYYNDNNNDGYALLKMYDPLTAFVDNEALDVGAGAVALANGTNNDYTLTVSRTYEIRRYLKGIGYVSYDAARADLDGEVYYVSRYSQVVDLAETDAAIKPSNPLPYAGKLCTELKSDAFLIPVQDLESYQDPTDSTNSARWAAALTLARYLQTSYSYTVLCQNDAVRALAEVAVNWRRDPDNLNTDAVVYFCPARVTEDVAVTKRISSIGATDANTWKDGNVSDFVAYGCLPGRTLELIDTAGVAGDEDVVYKFTLAGVTADELSTVTAMSTAQRDITTYRVVNTYFDADQEALYYGLYGEAIQNKAVRLIYPPTTQFENVEVPGYYLGVIRSAQFNVNNPATIYNKSVTPFVEKVITVFNREQLNVVASGGITVYYEQNTDLGIGGTPVQCRHAITTDRSIAVREEEAVVTEVDYCSRYIRNVFDPEQGKYHNDEMLDDGIATLAGGCKTHLEQELHCVQSIDLIKYEVSESEVRKMLYEWSVKPRIPNIWGDMTIHVVT